MKQKQPQSLGLEDFHKMDISGLDIHRFISSEIGFIYNINPRFSPPLPIGQPIRMPEGRIIFIRQGYAKVLMNLEEYTLKAGMLGITSPGSILQAREFSPDLNLHMLAFRSDFLPELRNEDFFHRYLSGLLTTFITLSEEDIELYSLSFSLLWKTLNHARGFSRATVKDLISAIFHQTECLCRIQEGKEKEQLSRQEQTYRRFIDLVNAHYKTERSVSFYADRLCLTPRYLNTLIRQASGKTVMDWVNEALVLEAKVLLRHSGLPVYRIADELHFANPSFFGKFFKRLTGMTPQAYAKQEV